MTTSLEALSWILIVSPSTSLSVDNAFLSPGERLSVIERMLLGLNRSFLTDSKKSSSSVKRDAGAFHREVSLIAGNEGRLLSTLESLMSWSLWKKTAALSLFSNFAQSSSNLKRLTSRGIGQNDGPLLSNDF